MLKKPTPFFDYLVQFEEGRALLDGYYQYQGQPKLSLNTAIRAIRSIFLQSDAQNLELKGHGLDACYIEGVLRFSFHGLPISMDAYRDYRSLLSAAERYVNTCVLAGKPTDFREVTRQMNEVQTAKFEASKRDVRAVLNQDDLPVIVLEAIQLWLAERLVPLRNMLVSDGKTYIKTVPYGTTTGREKHIGSNITQLPKYIRQDLIGSGIGKSIVTVDVVAEEIAILMALAGNKKGFAVYSQGKEDLYVHIKSQSKALQNLSRSTAKILIISYVYGMRFSSMSREFGISRLGCKQIISDLSRIFNAENNYLDKQETLARKNGYIEQYGCYMEVRNATSSTTVRNFFVQSTGAYLLREINNAINASAPTVLILFNLHDSITFAVDINDDTAVESVRGIIADVSERILGNGYRLRSEVEHTIQGGI